MFDGGINKFSGLLDLAVEFGSVVKPSNGWYQKVNLDTGEVIEQKYRAADTFTDDFWNSILSHKKFKDSISNKYQLVMDSTMLGEENV